MSRPAQPIKHGTYAGAQLHVKRGEKPCLECAAAKAQYHREYRRKNPDYAKAEQRRNHARARAALRLARLYPADFQRLLDEEIAKGARR